MSIEQLDTAQTTPKKRRVAAIFLPDELSIGDVDPFLHSQDFYKQHHEVLPQGFGIVSGASLDYEERGIAITGRETISFDARQAKQGEFGWQICYANRGAQKVARLVVQEARLSADYAETSNQGAIIRHFQLEQEEAELVQAHLLERLDSPEVEACIQEAYVRRQNIHSTLANLALKKKEEAIRWGSTPRHLDTQIAAQKGVLETTGFVPMLVFDNYRLKLLPAEQPAEL